MRTVKSLKTRLENSTSRFYRLLETLYNAPMRTVVLFEVDFNAWSKVTMRAGVSWKGGLTPLDKIMRFLGEVAEPPVVKYILGWISS